MRILHVADVHLDRPFVGMSPAAAKRRRGEVWETFVAALQVARDRRVDLVTIGGDLWEEGTVKYDTRNSVLYELGQLHCPVVVIAGNHDPLIPGGNWDRAIPDLPTNVVLVRDSVLEGHKFNNVTLWGASWTGGAGGDLPSDVVRSANPLPDGRNILLLHGTLINTLFPTDNEYCPFTEADVRAAGFDLCLAGHIHAAQEAGIVVYPGSVEPLNPSELGRHCVAIADIDESGVRVELVDIGRFEYKDVLVLCEGAQSTAEIASALKAALSDCGDRTYVKAHLSGAVAASVLVDPLQLAASSSAGLADLVVVDETHHAWDLERLASEPTVRGLFVQKLLDRQSQALPEEEAVIRQAIELGLRAFDSDVEVISAV